MNLRDFAMVRLIFLTLWTTICGPLSGFTMGLFFLVLKGGIWKGVPSSQGERSLVGFFEASKRMGLGDRRSFGKLATPTAPRLSSGHH